MAVETTDKSAVYIIPYLASIPEENWPLVDESKYTVYRHLVFTVPPYHVHSNFQDLAASVLQEYSRVTVGKYSLVIYSDDQYESRIDCGPCSINKTVTEVRVTVRADSQDVCRTGAEATVCFLQRCFSRFDSLCEIKVMVSCSACRQNYFDVAPLQEAAAARGENECHCEICHDNKSTLSDLLNGFKDSRPISDLDWHPFHRSQHPGM